MVMGLKDYLATVGFNTDALQVVGKQTTSSVLV
jgi:hypothetical protein